MHRYDELERKYYKRLYLKIFFYFIIVFALIITVIFIRKNFAKPKKIYKESNISIKQSFKEKKIVKKIEFNIKKENNLSKKINKKIKFILPAIKTMKVTKKIESNVSKTKELKAIKSENKKNKVMFEKSSFSLKEVSLNKQDIKLLIKNFNENPDYDLAVTIARYFLNDNNLKEAQKWALKANGLKPEDPDSWLIFANILQKENKIQKAIEILKVYKDSYGVNKKIEEKLRSLNAK